MWDGERRLEEALASTAVVAICDGWHQALLPNRTSSPWDVLIDCSGAIVLCLLAYAIVRFTHPERLHPPAA